MIRDRARRALPGLLRTRGPRPTRDEGPIEATATAPDLALSVDALTVRYGERTALSDVNLRLARGRVCALLGANGSGKSTLMRAVLGMQRATSGAVWVAGDPPFLARRRGAMAFVPQEDAVDRDFPISVREVVEAGSFSHCGPMRRLRAADHAAVQEALERVGLADVTSRQIGALSGGQRKRAFVARALAQGASLLLLDEPFAGVDEPSMRLIGGLLADLARGGSTVLIATHDLLAVHELAHDAVLLAGRVVAHGPVAEVTRPEVLAQAFGGGSPSAGPGGEPRSHAEEGH